MIFRLFTFSFIFTLLAHAGQCAVAVLDTTNTQITISGVAQRHDGRNRIEQTVFRDLKDLMRGWSEIIEVTLWDNDWGAITVEGPVTDAVLKALSDYLRGYPFPYAPRIREFTFLHHALTTLPLTTLPKGVFPNCTGLTSLTLSHGMSGGGSLVSIEEGALDNLTALHTLTIIDSTLKSIGTWKLPSLERLTLKCEQLQYMPMHPDALPTLKALYILGTPFHGLIRGKECCGSPNGLDVMRYYDVSPTSVAEEYTSGLLRSRFLSAHKIQAFLARRIRRPVLTPTSTGLVALEPFASATSSTAERPTPFAGASTKAVNETAETPGASVSSGPPKAVNETEQDSDDDGSDVETAPGALILQDGVSTGPTRSLRTK